MIPPRGAPGEWTYVPAHCLLHLALGHVREHRDGDPAWSAACDCAVTRYLADLQLIARRYENPPPYSPPTKHFPNVGSNG